MIKYRNYLLKFLLDINTYITIIRLPQDEVYQLPEEEMMGYIMVLVVAVAITIPLHQLREVGHTCFLIITTINSIIVVSIIPIHHPILEQVEVKLRVQI